MGGCISTTRNRGNKLELDDNNLNAFHVVNIDDNGTALWSGQLNVTRSEIILYRRGCEPTRWPLKCLRRYGFDTDLFSFEVGRRCATGEGIYAFRCRRAETIFQTLQNYIQMSTLVHDGSGVHSATNATANTARNDASSPMSTLSGGLSIAQTLSQLGAYILPNRRTSTANRASVASAEPRRTSDAPDSDYLEPIVPSTVIARGAFNVITHGCPSSSSFEPISPNSLNSLNNVSEMTTSDQVPLWTNALSDVDKDTLTKQVKKLSLDIPPQEFAPSPNLMLSNYVNGNRMSIEQLAYSPTKPLGDGDIDANQPTYVNVTPGEMPSSTATTPKAISADFKPAQGVRNPNNNNINTANTNNNNNNNNNYIIEYTPCYENLDLNSMRSFLRGYPRPVSRSSITSPSAAQMNDLFLESLASPSISKVNYIVLDLDQTQSVAGGSNTSATTPLKRDSIQSFASNGSPMKTPSVIGSFSRTISQSTTMQSMSSLLAPESPQRGDFDYVTIDFNKTVALSNSIATVTECEGSRRTRHSSTIMPNVTASTPHNSISD